METAGLHFEQLKPLAVAQIEEKFVSGLESLSVNIVNLIKRTFESDSIPSWTKGYIYITCPDYGINVDLYLGT